MFASPFFTSGRGVDSADHRHEGRTAHGEFADAVDAVDHAHHRVVSGRRVGHAVRIQARICVQRVFVSVFGVVHFAAACRRGISRGAVRCCGGQSRAAVARIRRGIAVHAVFAADSRHRIGRRGLGHGRRRGADPVQPVRRGGFSSRTGGDRHHLGIARASGWFAARWSRIGWAGRISFEDYKRTISICYVIHGGSYVLFSQARRSDGRCCSSACRARPSRSAQCLNISQLLRHVSDEFRGRVFATIESWTWMTMMVSMGVAGLASTHVSPRVIGAWSGRVQLDHGDFLGLGELDGTAAGTGAFRRRSGRYRGS